MLRLACSTGICPDPPCEGSTNTSESTHLWLIHLQCVSTREKFGAFEADLSVKSTPKNRLQATLLFQGVYVGWMMRDIRYVSNISLSPSHRAITALLQRHHSTIVFRGRIAATPPRANATRKAPRLVPTRTKMTQMKGCVAGTTLSAVLAKLDCVVKSHGSNSEGSPHLNSVIQSG